MRLPRTVTVPLPVGQGQEKDGKGAVAWKKAVEKSICFWDLAPTSWFLNTIYHRKEPGLNGEKSGSWIGTGKGQYEPGKSVGFSFILFYFIFCQKERNCPKNDGGLSKRHRHQLQGTSSGQIWDNLSFKINRRVTDFSPLNVMWIPECTLIQMNEWICKSEKGNFFLQHKHDYQLIVTTHICQAWQRPHRHWTSIIFKPALIWRAWNGLLFGFVNLVIISGRQLLAQDT